MTPEQLVEGSLELVSLPELYFQVDEMIGDPRYTAEDIGEVIISDPAMTAKLLKLVNSAFYGFPAKIETLTRAVTIVGMSELRSLILASSAIYEFSKIPNDLIDMGDFWMHSIHCGVLSKLLAKKSNVLHAERLFIAGLLHELGSLVIYNKLPDSSREILSTAGGDRRLIPGLEKELLGYTHADVSSAILEKWELPSALIESTKFHLAPEESASSLIETHLVYLANLLCGVEENGDSIQDALAEISNTTWTITGLSETDVLEVMEKAPEQLTQLFGLMVPASSGPF